MNTIIRYVCVVSFVFSFHLQAAENIRKIATWNMKWLGTNSGNQLDAVENVSDYSAYILRTEATLFALQEIGATHSVGGEPRCHYLDLVVNDLNAAIPNDSEKWSYVLDDKNKNQRLAFLYKKDLWIVSNPRSIRPGSSYNHIRRPFVVQVQATGTNAKLNFDYVNIHLKAFPDNDSRERRRENIQELAAWLDTTASLNEDVLVSGDTNLFFGESPLQKPFEDIDYVKLYDSERTSIHDDALGQVFDRYYCSADLKHEIDAAKNVVGFKDYIDVIKDNDPAKIIWFDQNISDHYPVVLNLDVSRER